MKWALIALVLAVVGCAARQRIPSIENPAAVNVIEKLVNTEAGAPAAERSMWPFMLAGLLCMVGGAVYFVLFKNWKLLAAGAAIALVPPLFFLILKPLVPWVAAGALIAGLMMLSKLGFDIWDHMRDKIVENKRLDGLKL